MDAAAEDITGSISAIAMDASSIAPASRSASITGGSRRPILREGSSTADAAGALPGPASRSRPLPSPASRSSPLPGSVLVSSVLRRRAAAVIAKGATVGGGVIPGSGIGNRANGACGGTTPREEAP